MNEANSISSAGGGEMHGGQWREVLSDAIHYWEWRRILYNAVLTAVVVIWIVSTWPHFRPAFTWTSFVAIIVLAMFANLCYCSAYVADIAMQFSSFREMWRRRRWGLWLLGMLFATVLANYWIADEIYSYVAAPYVH
ncbi:MAG TPA: hypothetical protein VJN90_02755 [Candidatus Acidoferrales bacterium]|nr:hypothetical protein [Candidatus Acidoferrales bacterium]